MDVFFKKKKIEEIDLVPVARVMDTFKKIAATKGDKSN